MSMETRLREYLVADTGVNAAIGTRLYLRQFPQRPVYPCAMYTRVDYVPTYSHNLGDGQGNTGWYRFQFTILADGAAGGDTVLDTVLPAFVRAFRKFNGQSGPGSPAVTDQAANFVLSGRFDFIAEPAQPITTYVFDVRLYGKGD